MATACTPPSTYAPHHAYVQATAAHASSLRVRDKRGIFQKMRDEPCVKPDSFLPHYGLEVGVFAVWQILNERPRGVSGSKHRPQHLPSGTASTVGTATTCSGSDTELSLSDTDMDGEVDADSASETETEQAEARTATATATAPQPGPQPGRRQPRRCRKRGRTAPVALVEAPRPRRARKCPRMASPTQQ
jgi:hypothetical protein